MTNNNDIEQFLKKIHSDDTKKGSLMMILKKVYKVPLTTVPKQFKKFCNDDTKKFNKVF